jgi:hypothetical protein
MPTTNAIRAAIVFLRIFFANIFFTENRNHGMVVLSLDRGAPAPAESGRSRLARRTEGIGSKQAGVQRHPQARRAGARPLQGLETGSGSRSGRLLLDGPQQSPCLCPRAPRLLSLGIIRGRKGPPRIPAHQGSRPMKSTRKWRRKRLKRLNRDSKMAPALDLPRETGGTETKTRETGNSPRRTSNASGPPPLRSSPPPGRRP